MYLCSIKIFDLFKMILKEFFSVFSAEKSTMKYLEDYGLLSCPINCHKCGNGVKPYQRNDSGKAQKLLRCKRKVVKLLNRCIIECFYTIFTT